MSYVPRLFDPTRPTSSLALGGGGPGTSGAPTSGASSPPPASDGGARFGALRSFFAANQPAADAQAQSLVAPINAEAQKAVDLSDQSSRMSENFGGRDTAIAATQARDNALDKVNALAKPSGIAGILGQGKDASYTAGQRDADAYLFGRTAPVNDAVNKWSGVLGALSPTYAPDIKTSEPKLNPVSVTPPDSAQGNYGQQPVVRVNPETGRKEKYDPYSGEWSPIQDRPGEG